MSKVKVADLRKIYLDQLKQEYKEQTDSIKKMSKAQLMDLVGEDIDESDVSGEEVEDVKSKPNPKAKQKEVPKPQEPVSEPGPEVASEAGPKPLKGKKARIKSNLNNIET
jgi:hypothetical protein